eukprot:jgi/Chlat1/8053/Chrsp73S07519
MFANNVHSMPMSKPPAPTTVSPLRSPLNAPTATSAGMTNATTSPYSDVKPPNPAQAGLQDAYQAHMTSVSYNPEGSLHRSMSENSLEARLRKLPGKSRLKLVTSDLSDEAPGNGIIFSPDCYQMMQDGNREPTNNAAGRWYSPDQLLNGQGYSNAHHFGSDMQKERKSLLTGGLQGQHLSRSISMDGLPIPMQAIPVVDLSAMEFAAKKFRKHTDTKPPSALTSPDRLPFYSPEQFLSPTMSMSARSSPTASSPQNSRPASHSAAERRRRDRFNERLNTLRDLVNCSVKADKTSVLENAIEYVKKLQLRTIAPASPGASRDISHRRSSSDQDPFAAPTPPTRPPPHLREHSQDSEESALRVGHVTKELSVENVVDGYRIRMSCKYERSVFSNIMQVLSNLQLDVVKADISASSDQAMNIIRVRLPEGNKTTASELRHSLQVVLDSDMIPMGTIAHRSI